MTNNDTKKNITNNNQRESNLNNNNKRSHLSYVRRKMHDLVEIRRKKLKELYELENTKFEYEMISKGNKIALKDEYKKETEIINRKTPEIKEVPDRKNLYNIDKYNFSISGNDIINNDLNSFDKKVTLTPNRDLEINKTYNQHKHKNELDVTIKLYNDNLEKLKLEDFMSRKRLQDDLLEKITKQMDKLRYGLNDKSYQEKLAEQWNNERREEFMKLKENSYNNFQFKAGNEYNFHSNYFNNENKLINKDKF
jgi:hypothetical protein